MTNRGTKPEEYREIKKHWIARLMYCGIPKEHPADNVHYAADADFDIHVNHHAPLDVLKTYQLKFKPLTHIHAVNGYGAHRPSWTREILRIEIREGRPEWGAKKGVLYFVLILGNKIISRNGQRI